MLESTIQSKLIKQYEADGFFVLKIIKANLLLIDKKTGVASWVEVKSKTGRISDIQKLRAREIRQFCNVQFITEDGEHFIEKDIQKVDGF
jgi:hypothetical protein